MAAIPEADRCRLRTGGGRIRTIGSAKMLPTFEATPVDFFWPDLSAKKANVFVIGDRRFEIPFPRQIAVAGGVVLGRADRRL
jgi:hypothetical protein